MYMTRQCIVYNIAIMHAQNQELYCVQYPRRSVQINKDLYSRVLLCKISVKVDQSIKSPQVSITGKIPYVTMLDVLRIQYIPRTKLLLIIFLRTLWQVLSCKEYLSNSFGKCCKYTNYQKLIVQLRFELCILFVLNSFR